MEFDTATLRPTYRFMQGVPGRSNAFEIARRLGLNEIIVKEAENLTDTDSDVNRIIEQLEAQTVETQKRWSTSRTLSKRTLNSTVRSRNSIMNSPMSTTRNSKRLKKKFKRWWIQL